MNGGDNDLPEGMKRLLRTDLLNQLKSDSGIEASELELFEWYSREHSKLLDKMFAEERSYYEQQEASGIDAPNDSGFVAVEYWLKRVRYSDVIYLTSLLEGFLERCCAKLERIIGEGVARFGLKDLKGDKWTTCKKFLEGYGGFTIPKEIWSEITLMTDVRNLIVHDNGSTQSLREEEKARLQKRPGIRADARDLVLEGAFVNHCLEVFRTLVNFMQERLAEVADRAIRPRPTN